MEKPRESIKGRGAAHNPAGRFESIERAAEAEEVGPESRARTVITLQPARSVISRNESPDLPFEQSLNPYQGCEHGCVYCYARPSHAYLGLSPGLDFETRIFAKPNAPALLREALSRPSYECKIISLGANTDPYQPAERKLGITRGVLEVLWEFRHPVGIVTKGSAIERDIDLLQAMAGEGLAQVLVSIGTLDGEIARTLEPRAPAPRRRIETVRRLSEAGIPVGTLVAPIIPFLNDKDMEAVLEAVAEAGAKTAGYTLIRLPWEVRELFKDWLNRHVPMRAERIMARIRDSRGGRENDPNFGSRMRGEGEFARLLQSRFDLACKKLGLNFADRSGSNTARFRRPTAQQSLF